MLKAEPNLGERFDAEGPAFFAVTPPVSVVIRIIVSFQRFVTRVAQDKAVLIYA